MHFGWPIYLKMAWIIDFSSKNIVSQKVYQETVNQLVHSILRILYVICSQCKGPVHVFFSEFCLIPYQSTVTWLAQVSNGFQGQWKWIWPNSGHIWTFFDPLNWKPQNFMTDSYLGLQIMLKSGLVRISNKVTGNEFGNLGPKLV